MKAENIHEFSRQMSALSMKELAGMRGLSGEPFDMALFTEDLYMIGDGKDA